VDFQPPLPLLAGLEGNGKGGSPPFIFQGVDIVTGVQNSNCIKLLFYKLYNIEHCTYIYIYYSFTCRFMFEYFI
jgi:hypothetical protein